MQIPDGSNRNDAKVMAVARAAGVITHANRGSSLVLDQKNKPHPVINAGEMSRFPTPPMTPSPDRLDSSNNGKGY